MNTKFTKLKRVLSSSVALSIFLFGAVSVQAQEEQTSFENANLANGVRVQDSQWSTLGFNKTDGNEDRFTIDNSQAKSGNRSLKVSYPEGAGGLSNSGGQDVLLMTPRDEYVLSYHVRFDEDFDWGDPSKNVGGKLPGLSGGAASANAGCSGGENCNGSNGFSVRYMWRENGEAHIYVYDMDKSGRFPARFPLRRSNGNKMFFPRGEWIHLVMRVKVNTGSSNNGEVQVWINNEEVLNKTDYKFVTNGDKVEKFLFSTFHGGSGSNWAPRRNNTAWFDDVLITTNLDDVFDVSDSDNDGVPDVIDGCPEDPLKSATGICGCGVPETACSFEEQFDDGMINDNLTGQFDASTGEQLTKINVEETPCGELKISAKPTLGTFDPIFLTLLNATDFSDNPVIEVRARSTEPVDLRIDLRDDVNTSAKTSGNTGKITREVKGDPLLWQTLRFEFPASAFTESGVDINRIKSMDIFFDAGEPGFDGELFIDYIAFGAGLGNANSTCISGTGTLDCADTPGGDAFIDACGFCVGGESDLIDCSASTLFLTQFDGQSTSISGTAITDGIFDVEETGCGEAKIENPLTKTGFSTLFLTLNEPIDISNNQKIIVRARATEEISVRFDFRDAANNTTSAANNRITFAGNPNEWAVYTFDFDDGDFAPTRDIDKTNITRLSFIPAISSTKYNGTLWIDYIAVGQEPAAGSNADDVCVIGEDCNGDVGGTAIYDRACETCILGNTNIPFDFCITSVDENSSADALILFPNPTNGLVTLSAEAAWEVVSLQQTTLATGEGSVIDMTSFEEGIYIVRANGQSFKVVRN